MSKSKSAPLLSPEKYLRTRARTLPLGMCYINECWKSTGMAFIIVTRKHVNGNLTFGVFQVDLHCLGVKDAFWHFNVSSLDVDEIIKTQSEKMNGEDPLVDVEYELVHNIIYGAIEYAEELGFTPHKDFNLVKNILEEDDEHIDLVEIEFGLNGKPAIYPGKEHHPKNIIAQLERSVGPGNFYIISPDEEIPEYDEDMNTNFFDPQEDEFESEYDDEDIQTKQES